MKKAKKAKRPAHEVILSMVRMMLGDVKDDFSDGLLTLAAIGILLDVLREMVIPEKEREKVLVELKEIASLWETNINLPNMPAELYNTLSHEK